MYDLKLLWWQDSIKSSQAIICVRWLKETDVSVSYIHLTRLTAWEDCIKFLTSQ
jgi:hypothetical protein